MSSGVLQLGEKTFPIKSFEIFRATRLDEFKNPTDYVRSTMNISIESAKGDDVFWKTVSMDPGREFDGEISYLASDASNSVNHYYFTDAKIILKKDYYLEATSFPMTLEILLHTDEKLSDNDVNIDDLLNSLNG